MVRELERTGRLSLGTFWARRAKRLLPATALVLAGVTVLSLVFLPQFRWADTAGDIVGAALYVVNWMLAASSVDYLAQDYAASPVQHFWSLAVEEQYYLIWPVLTLVLAGLSRRLGWSLRHTLLIGVTLLTAGSLLWSIRLDGQPEAYFVTTTRAWELGIGAAVALLAPRLQRLNVRVAQLLTWAGVLGLAVIAFCLPDTVTWPSWHALAPTLATAAVIAGGPAAGAAGAVFLIGRYPFRWVGDLSYSLYLWHWPLVVFATAHWEKLGQRHGLFAVGLSVIPAWLTYRLVESPLHHSRTLARRPMRALGLGAACTAIGVAAGLALSFALPNTPVLPASAHPGALALTNDPQSAIPEFSASSITPDPLNARDDLPDLYGRKCQGTYVDSTPKPCLFAPPTGPRPAVLASPAAPGSAAASPAASAPALPAPAVSSSPAASPGPAVSPAPPGSAVAGRTPTVALVGDSRAAQWSPAMQAVAAAQHWRLITITKAGCPFTQAHLVRVIKQDSAPYRSCSEWDEAAMKLLLSGPNRPDFVVTSSYYPYLVTVDGHPDVAPGPSNDKALIAGLRGAWSTLNQAGIPVIALRETPLMGRDVAECVSKHRQELNRCTTTRAKALRTNILQPAAEGLPASATIDLTTSAICPAVECPPVIGNVLVYRDDHHLTAEYSRSLAPFLTSALAKLRAQKFAHGRLDAVLPVG